MASPDDGARHPSPPGEAERDYIKFLGTAGARYVMARQLRYSAGIYLHLAGQRLMLDPGPGALVRCAKSRPPVDVTRLDGIILTHMHIDHTNDANVLIDAMTGGGFRRHGALFAPRECLEGENRVILPYLKGYLERIEVLGPEREYRLGDLRFATSVRHHHTAETYGIVLHAGGRRVGFLPDTGYFPELAGSYRGVDLLVMNVTFHEPYHDKGVLHLSVEDAERLVREIRPKKAILTHLGMMLLRENPRRLSLGLTDRLGVETVLASDGMTEYLPPPGPSARS